MPKLPRALWIAFPLAAILYLYGLGATGMLGPDEPRYASISRAMAQTGDWVTPRLWGEPWFEKPVLLYWIDGAAFRLGLSEDFAPRLPVALLALSFLLFYWWILQREFGPPAAWYSALILGTTAAWMGFSQVGVTDLPMSATFSAAMLLALPWLARGDRRWLPLAAAMLGFAVLAKSLVPVVLSAPLWLLSLKQRRLWPGLSSIAIFLIVALPWHVFCYVRNGRAFTDTLFLQHQFGRFTSTELKHGQPWWFYVPCVIGLLLPWSPLLALAGRPATQDVRRQLLLLWFVFGLVFLSIAPNKLPGYVLPLMPAVAALAGIALAESRRARVPLMIAALLLVVFLVAAPMLPAAVANGLSRAPRPAFSWTWLLPVGAAVAVWLFETRGRRVAAVLTIALGAAAGMLYIKRSASPELDRQASARQLWRQISGQSDRVCVDWVKRDLRYGLNYYSVTPLPDCTEQPRTIQIAQPAGQPAQVVFGR